MITADHGNAEEILDDEDKPMTAHTTNLVPVVITDKNIKLTTTDDLEMFKAYLKADKDTWLK